MSDTRPPVVIIGPTPPPYHGVAVSTRLILDSPAFAAYRVLHLDTADRRPIDNIGVFEPRNVALGLWHALQLLGMLARYRPRLVYLPVSQGAGGYLRDLLFILPCEVAGVPVVAHLRGSEFRAFYAGAHPILQALIRYSLARVARVIVLGETLRALFDGLVPRERIAIVPNGTPDLPPGTASAAQRDGRVVRALFLSNLRVRKGVLVALEAAIIALQRVPALEFVFAGAWEVPAVRDQALARLAASGVAGRVCFTGEVAGEAKQRLLCECDFFVFPPVEPEGHPRVVLEAMAAGLPVIASRQGAIVETVVDGETGFLVASGDVWAVAERVVQLAGQPDLRARMRAAARARFLSEYTVEIAHARLAQVFASVLKGE
jgi:glycosyltransferase involved in cell wall biosynthesis